jgi:transposase-like protein
MVCPQCQSRNLTESPSITKTMPPTRTFTCHECQVVFSVASTHHLSEIARATPKEDLTTGQTAPTERRGPTRVER